MATSSAVKFLAAILRFEENLATEIDVREVARILDFSTLREKDLD